MDIFGVLRGLFGPNFGDEFGERGRDHQGPMPPEGNPRNDFFDFNRPQFREQDDDESEPSSEWPRDFMRSDFFTNPLDNRYFEQQIDEMISRLRRFGGPDIGFAEIPRLPPAEEKEGLNLRDKMLKPNEQEPMGYIESSEKKDEDLDEKISKGGLQQLFPEKQMHQMYLSSVTVRRIQRPDGSFEEHRTVRDGYGKEETTITRKIGDQSHTVKIIKEPSEIQEIIESFDEDNAKNFAQETPSNFQDWSFFRKFFGFSK